MLFLEQFLDRYSSTILDYYVTIVTQRNFIVRGEANAIAHAQCDITFTRSS